MPCKLGCPKAAKCPFGHEGKPTRKDCGRCVNYVPPPHVANACMLYDRTGEVCLKPMSACASCPERKPPERKEVDWGDLRDVREYGKAYRAGRREADRERLRVWREEHPDYMRNYYRENADKILRRAKARYRRKKQDAQSKRD